MLSPAKKASVSVALWLLLRRKPCIPPGALPRSLRVHSDRLCWMAALYQVPGQGGPVQEGWGDTEELTVVTFWHMTAKALISQNPSKKGS